MRRNWRGSTRTRSAPIKLGLTEGPTVAPDGSIYFSDIPFGKDNGMILRFDPKTKKIYMITAEGTVDPAKKINTGVAPFYPNRYFPDTFMR